MVESRAQEESLRIRLDLAYDGTDFSGWAAQPGLRTVEGEMSSALTTVLRAHEPVRLTVAGRTYAAVGVAAWEALPGRSYRAPSEAALSRLRGVLPADVVVHAVRVAPDGFDARFAARRRRSPC